MGRAPEVMRRRGELLFLECQNRLNRISLFFRFGVDFVPLFFFRVSLASWV